MVVDRFNYFAIFSKTNKRQIAGRAGQEEADDVVEAKDNDGADAVVEKDEHADSHGDNDDDDED